MAFHPYPQVIGALFNVRPSGPPRGLTPASACPRVAHPASRLRPATRRPVGTRSRCGSLVKLNLAAERNSLAHSTKGTPSHLERCSDALRAHGFRYCITPLPGCFSPFPHGTCPLSVTWECSGLDGGPPRFGPGTPCPALLRHRAEARGGSRTGLSPCSAGLPRPFRSPAGLSPPSARPYNPGGA